MNAAAPIDPAEFVRLVEPLVARRDVGGLTALVKGRWSYEQVQQLLGSDHLDAKKLALLAMAMVGKQCCLPEVARHLRDDDPVVREVAEHAMWSIWFRLGATPEANHQLARGAQALKREDFEHAIEHFDRALAVDPEFAEAYNQRAIALYLLERFDDSLRDCREAVRRMPMHFGALAGMGHCQAHLGRLREAVASYERVLEIHPHNDCVRQAVGELKQQLGSGTKPAGWTPRTDCTHPPAPDPTSER